MRSYIALCIFAVALVGSPSLYAQRPVPAPQSEAVHVLLLLPAGPLLLECNINIDDAPHYAHREKSLAESYAKADANNDGKVTWDELLDTPQLGNRMLGHLRFGELRERVKRNCDANGDGLATLEEARAMFNQQIGFAPLIVQRHDRKFLPTAIAKTLDVDASGTLSPAEIDGAAAALKKLDADGNEVLDYLELTGEVVPPRCNPFDRDPVVVQLDTLTDWEALRKLCAKTYGGAEQLALDKLGFARGSLARLDEDKSGTLDEKELAALPTLKPHATLAAQLGKTSADERLTVTTAKMPQGREAVAADHYCTWNLPGARLRMQLAMYQRDASTAERKAEEFFEGGDRNGDGFIDGLECYLGREYLIGNWDLNGDERADRAELTSWSQQHLDLIWSYASIAAVTEEDSLFAVLDVSGDHRLSARECRDAPSRLRTLIKQGDDSLELASIEPTTILAIGIGNRAADGLQVPALSYAPAQPSLAPFWFRALDRNQDGDLSLAEYSMLPHLGGEEGFNETDSDKDGLIDEREAIASKRGKPRN